MEDKEVGELWRKAKADQISAGYYIQALIRKLVLERATQMTGGFRPVKKGDIDEALSDFGIDPKDWPAE